MLAFLGSSTVGGCEIYRITLPFSYMGSNGWQANWLSLDDATRLANARGLGPIFDHDVYVFPRLVPREQDTGVAALREMLHMAGKAVVYETDDDYTNEHRKVHGGGEKAIWLAAQCDAITVSTPYLRKLMLEKTDRPVHMLPNCVDTDWWASTASFVNPSDYITIGLMGSETHAGDWAVLETVLPRILQDYPKARVLLGGYHPDYLKGLGERAYYQEAVPYKDYPLLMAAADIVLCPVDPEDRFNWSKSAIKAIEGMAAGRFLPNGKLAGAAVIATDMPIYRRAINHRSNGLLVEHTPEAWDQAIRSLLDDAYRRWSLQRKGHKWVRKNRNIKQEWKLWATAYKDIFRSRGVITNSRHRRVPT